MEEKRICKVCGRELEIYKFLKSGGKPTSVCKECAARKKAETWAKKRNDKNLEHELENAKNLRLQDFTARELFAEIKRRGYEFKATYTEVHTINSKDF